MERPPAAFTGWFNYALKKDGVLFLQQKNRNVSRQLIDIKKRDGRADAPNVVFVTAKPVAKRTVTGGFTRDISVFRWMSRLRVSGCYRDKKERSRETAGAQDCR